MDILKVFPCAIRANGNGGELFFFDGRGSLYSYKEGSLRLEKYENQKIYGIAHYMGEKLIVRGVRNDPPSLSMTVTGDYLDVQNACGKRIELSPVEKCALFYSFNTLDSLVYFKMEGYPCEDDISLARVDMAIGAVKIIPLSTDEKYMRAQDIDGDCYGISGPRKAIIKYNNSLEKVWEYAFEGQKPSVVKLVFGISYKDTVNYNLRMKEERRQRLDGEIFSFAKEDGAVRWTQKFPFQIEDCVLLPRERLAAISSNELYVLNANSGEILISIGTGLPPQNCSSYLHASESHLFVFSKKDQLFQIYDMESWQCVRTVRGAEIGLHFDYPGTIIKDHLFLTVRILEDNYFCGGCLVIDLKNVHSPVEFEKEPVFQITPPSAENGALILEVEHGDLGDVLRLAEIYGLKHATLNGNTGNGLGGNSEFNGKVILRYGGFIADRVEAHAKLDILKERFEYYAKEDRIRCGKKLNAVTFDYELI